MAGDFNEEPQNPPIFDLMLNKYEFIDLYKYWDRYPGFNDQYKEFNKDLHSKLTTYKYRAKDKGWVKRTIDYIFLKQNEWYRDNGIIVMALLDPGDLEDKQLLNNKIGNPCPNHPSDHYCIGY